MEVKPLVIDLNATRSGALNGTFQVHNIFETPLPVEIRIQQVGFDERGIVPTGKPSDDLLVFPTQAIIQPGQTQNFRVQYVGDPALARSQHYYVSVAQLPVKLPQGQSGLQILYNFQVLVSVGARGLSPDIHLLTGTHGVTDKKQSALVLDFENRAGTYGYLSQGRLRIIEKDASGKELARRTWTPPQMLSASGIGLMGPNAKRRVVIPFEFASPDSQISGDFEYAARR